MLLRKNMQKWPHAVRERGEAADVVAVDADDPVKGAEPAERGGAAGAFAAEAALSFLRGIVQRPVARAKLRSGP